MTKKQAIIHGQLAALSIIAPTMCHLLDAPRLVTLAAFLVFFVAFCVWPTNERPPK